MIQLGKENNGMHFSGEQFAPDSLLDRCFFDCTFEQCLFHEMNLKKSRFSDCTFKGCSLQLPKFDGCRLQGVLFDESKIVGADFFTCDEKFFSIQCRKSILVGCNFSNMKMKQFIFSGSKLTDCQFLDTVLIEADFRECNLQGALFHHADLSKADFRDATNYAINPQSNSVKKARFSAPEALSLLEYFDVDIH